MPGDGKELNRPGLLPVYYDGLSGRRLAGNAERAPRGPRAAGQLVSS
jgi:hypothetical protein